jgi:hypothetical protein
MDTVVDLAFRTSPDSFLASPSSIYTAHGDMTTPEPVASALSFAQPLHITPSPLLQQPSPELFHGLPVFGSRAPLSMSAPAPQLLHPHHHRHTSTSSADISDNGNNTNNNNESKGKGKPEVLGPF